MTPLELGADLSVVRAPGGEPPWFPYKVPVDAADATLREMGASELVTALADTAVVVQRAAQEDEWPIVDADTFDALLDIRDRLQREIHRRLLEVEHQADRERLLRQRVATSSGTPRTTAA